MKNKNLEWAWLMALLLVPVVLWVLPGDFFDETGVEVCPSKLIFDIECLGCGMTRAVMHMHHLQFADAIYYNQGVVLVFPALVVIWCMWVYKSARRLGLVKAKTASV